MKPVKIVRHSFPEDIKIIRDVIRSCYPNYYDAWIQLYDEDGSSKIENCSNCELFYLGQREFEAYCEFLFGVLFKVRSIIGDVNRPPYHKRYCAFLGERLLSVYLLANKLDVTYAYMLIYRIFPLNIVRRVFRLFGFSRTPVYLNLRKRLNKNRIRRSSWR